MSTHLQTPTQTISTRFGPDTLARLDEVATLQKRSRSDIIKEAVDGYLEAVTWLEAEVKKGIEDLKNGRSVSHKDVKEKFKKLGVHVD
jgi:predicted transcriptional regulator